jgi:hypothetical protein
MPCSRTGLASGVSGLLVVMLACRAPGGSAAAKSPLEKAPWAPRGVAALSVFESLPEGCAWRQAELPSLQWRTLVVLPGRSCRGARLALSTDRRVGAIWFDSSATSLHTGSPKSPSAERDGAPPEGVFLVEEGRELRRLVPPPDLSDLGFDSRGRLFALALQPMTVQEISRGEVLVNREPLKIAAAADGPPFVALAFVLQGSAWQRVETFHPTSMLDPTVGIASLKAAADLGFRSSEVLVSRIQGDDENDSAILDRLVRFAPQTRSAAGENGWIRFGSGSTWFEVWAESSESSSATGLAAFLDSKKEPVRPESWPFTEKDALTYSWKGRYLLARVAVEGSRPRIYEGSRLLWSSEGVTAVTFWPERRSQPSAH